MPQAVNPPVMYYQGTPYGLGGVTMVDKHSVMTMLYSRETGDSEDVITLSEDFDHFDLLIISGKAYITDGLWHQSNAYICDSLAVGNRVSIGDDSSISWFDIYDKTTLSRALDAGNSYQITHVMGVKFNGMTAGGGKGGVDYSMDEQDTGLKWIDGSPVYQKTYYIESVPVGGIFCNLANSQDNIDKFISYEWMATRSDGKHIMNNSLMADWMEGSSGISEWDYDVDHIRVKISDGYYSLSDVYITLKYTKSSS